MNSIVGFTEMLLESVPEHFQTTLKDIQFAGAHLMKLLNDVLDLSQLEHKQVVLQQNEFCFEEMLQDVYGKYQAIHSNSKVAFRLDSNQVKLDYKLIGDKARLHKAICNLVDNALKFTEKGAVTLKAAVVEHNNTAKVQIEVIDTGIGIAKEKQALIFNSFSEFAGVKEKQFAGNGLGLSISQYITELHGSKLQLESTLGEGSRFFFKIELPISKTPIRALVRDHVFEGQKVLLVEDNLLNQKLAKKALELKNMHVTTAENGEIAVNAMQESDYDLILMDLNMPVMDGFEATRQIRAMDAPKGKTPIVVLTALDDDARTKIEAYHISAYVRKPFKTRDLYETIQRATAKTQAA